MLILSTGIGCKTVSRLVAKGGVDFTVQIETKAGDKVAVLDQAVKVTQSKLDLMGLTGEAKKDPAADTFVVRLYDPVDVERVKSFLFTAYQLELRKVVSPPNPAPIQTYPTADDAKLLVNNDREVLLFSEREDADERPGRVAQFVLVETSPIVTGEDIRDAQAVSRTGSQSDYQISFTLVPHGAVRFGDWTGKNIGNYLAIVLDGKVRSIAFIKSQIFDSGEISGRFTKEQAENIAMSLKSGYLPAKMKIIDERRFEK